MKHQVNVAANQQPSATAMPKYTIFQSLQHMMGAVKRNPLTFGVSLIVSYVVSAIALILIARAAASLFLSLGQSGLLFASFGTLVTSLIAVLVIYTLLYALVYAFTVGCIAYSLSQEKLGIGTTLKKALQSTPRVVKVNAWVAIVAYWPIAIAASLPLLLFSGQKLGGNPLPALLTPILIIAALIWALIAQLRYALAPYLALFEPDVPVKQALKRSEQLLKNGGQWFVFKGVLLLIAMVIFLGIITGSNLRQLENSDDWSINIIFIVVSILIEGAMVMLYLNRTGKQTASNAPKSPRLALAAVALLVGLLGFAAFSSKNDTGTGSLSKADQEAFMKIADDAERKTEVKTIAKALEGFYDEHGYYPAAADVANPEWASKNLKQKIGEQSMALTSRRLADPKGSYINGQASDYQYKTSPENCTQCASFELTARLEEGKEYKQSSLNNSVKNTSSPTTAQ